VNWKNAGVQPVTSNSPISGKAESLLQSGMKKFERQDYQDAIAELKRAIAVDPNFAQAYSAWGNTCFAMQDYQSAIVCFEQAIRLDPYLAKAYGGRGLAYYEMGDKQRALDDFTRSIEINPTLPHAYHSRGEVSLELDNIPQALADFEQAIDLYLSTEDSSLENPDNASTLHRIQNHYRSGITYRHSTAESLIKRARTAIQEERFQEALDHLAKGIQLEPDLAELYYGRSAAYWSLGQIQEALDSLSHAIHLNSRSANFYNDRGHIYFQQINQACIPDFKQAIKLDPYLVSAYFNLGVVYAGLGNKQDALYYFQRAATLFQQQGNRQGHEEAIQAISQVNHSL
jgi:tetratricopeptide (TPR) repeat protein